MIYDNKKTLRYKYFILLSLILIVPSCYLKRSHHDVYSARNIARKYCYTCHAPLVKLEGASFEELRKKFKGKEKKVINQEFGLRPRRNKIPSHTSTVLTRKEKKEIVSYLEQR